MRETVIDVLPKAPGLPKDSKGYLEQMTGIYQDGACNLLLIEGYQVTLELIEKFRLGQWSPDGYAQGREQVTAMAASG